MFTLAHARIGGRAKREQILIFMKKQSASRNGATRQAKAELLLAEALDRMLAGQPPPYGRTWTTCLKIKRFLRQEEIKPFENQPKSDFDTLRKRIEA